MLIYALTQNGNTLMNQVEHLLGLELTVGEILETIPQNPDHTLTRMHTL